MQEILADEGYDTGRADGVLGPRTQGAIRAYQLDYGMPVTGIVTPDLIVTMGLAAYASELSGGDGKQYEAPVAAKTEVAASRKLAPLKLIPPIVSGNASIDSDGTADPAPAKPAGDTRQLASAIPPVAARFAPRNWLVSDLSGGGLPAAAPFGVFLEEGGSVVGPRYAKRLRWEADGVRFSMVYRNSIGQEIRRTGKLNGLNRLEAEAVGPDGNTWRWVAEAKPL